MTDEAQAETSPPPPPEFKRRLQERRERHLQRSRPHRLVIVVLGFLVTATGIVMTGPVPGPGILVIPVGLAILALEFAWAERLLERAHHRAEAARRTAAEASTLQKVVSAAVTLLAIAAAVSAAILFDIPYLPV